MEYHVKNYRNDQLKKLLDQRIKELDSLRKKYVKVLRENLELKNTIDNAKIRLKRTKGAVHSGVPEELNKDCFEIQEI